MNTVRLTRRGRIVRNIVVAIALYLLFAWLNDITTPEHCKVAFEDMSESCKRLLYS
jgi:hypothetical protein